MSDTNPTQIHATGEATGFIPAPGDKGKPITVIGIAYRKEKNSAATDNFVVAARRAKSA